MGICPTCYNLKPRAEWHTVIVSQAHCKDMIDIPDELCREIYSFARRAMIVLREVYHAESVYLCTMCDGPMNHFHVQLIPRYPDEKRGSKNFVKPRKEYVHDGQKIAELRKLLK